MCGIFGIISAFNTQRSTFALARGDDILRDGMIVTSLRGMDSTGVFQVQETGCPFLYKKAVPSPYFVDDQITQTYFRAMTRSMVTVAHCRAATHGSVTDENAHPFEIPYTDANDVNRQLIGVHNGSLLGWQSEKNAKGFKVDSEFALAQIATRGADFLKNDIPSGAYSFVWWDSAAPTLVNFARNAERPMWMLRSKDKHHIIFASEPMMISMVLDRRGGLSAFEDEVVSTNPYTYYTVDAREKELEIREVSHWDAPKSTSTVFCAASDWAAKNTSNFFSKIDAIVHDYEQLGDYDAPREGVDDDAVPMEFSDKSARGIVPTTFAMPCESGEIGKVPEDELYMGDVSSLDSATAEERGTFGDIVVFKSSGYIVNGSWVGSIQCLTDESGYNAAVPTQARLIWPGKGHHNISIPDGARRFAAIVGIEKLAHNSERFILSPLKVGAVVQFGKIAQDWREENCPNVSIGM